jgi:hypothetical protein
MAVSSYLHCVARQRRSPGFGSRRGKDHHLWLCTPIALCAGIENAHPLWFESGSESFYVI